MRTRRGAAVAIVAPQTVFEERLNQLDVRFTKILRVRKTRLQGMFDIYNVTNSSVALTYNSTYGSTWLRPNSFMAARWVKVTGQFSF